MDIPDGGAAIVPLSTMSRDDSAGVGASHWVRSKPHPPAQSYSRPSRPSPYPLPHYKQTPPSFVHPSSFGFSASYLPLATMNLCSLPPDLCHTVPQQPCTGQCESTEVASCEAAGPSSVCVQQCVVVGCDDPVRPDCSGACDTSCDLMDWLVCDEPACEGDDADNCIQCLPQVAPLVPTWFEAFSSHPLPHSTPSLISPLKTSPVYQQAPQCLPAHQETMLRSHPRPPNALPPFPEKSIESSPPAVCLWGACRDTFQTHRELVAHVNAVHLRVVPPSAPGPLLQNEHALACHWAECEQQMSIDRSLNTDSAPLYSLANHLLQDHLGLPPTTYFDLLSSSLPTLLPPLTNCGYSAPLLPSTTLGPSEATAPHRNLPDNTTTSPGSSFASPSYSSTVSPPQSSTSPSTSGVTLSPSPHSLLSIKTSEASGTASTSRSSLMPVSSTNRCMWSGCGRDLDDVDALSSHIVADHVGSGKREYFCGWAGCDRVDAKGFSSKQKIMRHLQSHTGHRPFECTICGQHFSEVATLQQHMRRHTSEKPYVCDHPGCGKSFAVAGALTIHKRTHSGDKPFKCPHCDRAFAESSNLSKHLRTHTGAKPYSCPEPGCGKNFSRPDQLNRHRAVHTRKKQVNDLKTDPLG